MHSFWGLIRAYWVSDRWREAWALTLAILLLTAAASKTSVWMAVASGELLNSIVNIHDPLVLDPLAGILSSAGFLVLLVLIKEVGFVGLRHLLSTTLHRKWRGWLNGRFNDALLDTNHTHFHLQQGNSTIPGSPAAMPDNIDQRIHESIKGMTGGAIGLAMGIAGVATSVVFIGQSLLQLSTEISGFEFLGRYGSATFAFVAIAVYVPVSTWIAARIGRILEKLTLKLQQTEGSYRGELTIFLRRSFQVAASRGEGVQRSVNGELYGDIDKVWSQLNKYDAGYMSFTAVYNFFAARIVAYLPGLLPYMSNTISLKNYITGAELVGSMINDCSWFIQVMPAIANLKANAGRVTELAGAINLVQKPSELYQTNGVSEFRYGTQHEFFGLTIRNLELMHRETTAQPFLSLTNMRFRQGDWVYLKGESGSGKSCVLKAINGLWPHGRGDITFPEGVTTLYAAQDIKLPSVSLKQLISLPMNETEFPDTAIATALYRAGMGDLIEHLHAERIDGTTWDQMLSGGQKQKLVLTRILLHAPGILFLDEATSALDPHSKIAFHQAIKDHCPAATVISVMHDQDPPKSLDGFNFYSFILDIRNGRAELETLSAPAIAFGHPTGTIIAAE
ncbi:ABC transporter ATP-binding protein/permease [Phyllobacterium myrsinacearum]|nr:ABC transporter ATP-binding protein/permease [Phyllobacterium myrsinacearum]